MTSEPLTITLTRYNEPNWLLWETLESLSHQQDVQAEVLFLDQIEDVETQNYVKKLSSEAIHFDYRTIPAKSLSFARNFAIKHAANDRILFIDSDAIADPSWAFEMGRSLSQNNVAVAGGRIKPKWHKPPLAIARAQVVWEQYSLLDLGEHEIPFHKAVGASFGINRSVLGETAYFDENLGRKGGNLMGGEDTELCDRAAERNLAIMYNGRAVVHHQILPERIRYRWILKRIYFAGLGRAAKGGRPSPTHKSRLMDYLVLPIILPWYAAGYLRGRKLTKT